MKPPRVRGPLATPPPDNPRKRQMEWETVETPGEAAVEAARRRLAALEQVSGLESRQHKAEEHGTEDKDGDGGNDAN